MVSIIKIIGHNLPTNVKLVRQYRARKVIYDVEMHSVADSQAIRDAYGLFFRRKSGRRLPDGLRGLSVSNVTTFSTRVRVRLLKEVCQRHQAANPSLSCFVTGYLPRPELKIRDRKGPLLSYSYTKTVEKLSHHLTLEFLKDLYKFARTNLPEDEVTERFLVLTSDLLCTTSPDLLSMSVDEGGVAEVAPVAQVPTPPHPSTSGQNSEYVVSMPPSQLNSTPSLNPSFIPPPGSSGLGLVTSPNIASQPELLTATSHTVNQAPHPSNPSGSSFSFFSPDTNQQIESHPTNPSDPADGQEAEDDFTLVPKRNRNRFTKKTTPYAVPR